MSKSGAGPFLSGCWRCERTWPCPGKILSPVQPLDLCTPRVLRQQTISPFLQTRTSSPREISHLARGAPSQRPVCPEGRSDEAGDLCPTGPQSRWPGLEWPRQVSLGLPLCSMQSQVGKDGSRRRGWSLPGLKSRVYKTGGMTFCFPPQNGTAEGDAAVISGGAVAAGGGIPLPEPPRLQPHLLPAF